MIESFAARAARLRLLDLLDTRVRQFRARDGVWPFRLPPDPIDLAELAGQAGAPLDALRPRTLLRFEWHDGHVWEAVVATLASGVLVYCDRDAAEVRLLASARRGNPAEADGFFLERLARSRGADFGIALVGAPPDHVRTSITDRAFLRDIFVDLFEESAAEDRRAITADPPAADFSNDVEAWLERVLIAPPPGRTRQKRLRDATDNPDWL
jgi:hypothetical protein